MCSADTYKLYINSLRGYHHQSRTILGQIWLIIWGPSNLPGCSCYDRKGCTVHPRDTDVAQEPESSYMYPHGSIMSALISCGLVAVVIINITSPSVPTTPLQAFPFKTNNRRCRRLLLGSEIDALWFVMGTMGRRACFELDSMSGRDWDQCKLWCYSVHLSPEMFYYR